MRNRTFIFGLIAALAATASALTVPRTSEATINASPLQRGEFAYIVEGDAATAYIGTDAGPLRVSDPSTLRGSRLVEVPVGKFTVVPDSNWTATSNGWTLASQNVTARLVVTSVDGGDIADVGYKVDAISTGLFAADLDVQFTYNGPTVILDCKLTDVTASATIYNITPTRRAFGDRDIDNDLAANRFILTDKLGTFDLYDLRRWTRDLYNGNRGEDWAAYKAKKRVNLAGQALRFDDAGHYFARMNARTNLAVVVDGAGVMEFTTGRGAIATGTLAITNVNATGLPVLTVGYTADIQDFNPALLRVQRRGDLCEDEWEFMDPARYTASADTVTISGCGEKHEFYRLWYNGLETSAFEVVFRASVRLESALYLRGEDNVLYKITVNAGVISATAQTE